MNKLNISLVLSGILLSACVIDAPTQWDKTNIALTKNEINKDLYDCKFAQNNDEIYLKNKEENIDNCMISKGYHKVNPASLPRYKYKVWK